MKTKKAIQTPIEMAWFLVFAYLLLFDVVCLFVCLLVGLLFVCYEESKET